MSTHVVWAGTLAALAFATPLEAQRAAPPAVQITPYAGYLRSGAIVSGPLGTALRNAGAPVYGAEMSLGLTPALALVGNVAYSRPGLEVGAPIVGGFQVAESSVLLYDAALRLRLPLAGAGSPPITPFLQGGAGAMRQSVQVSPVTTSTTNFAYHVGAGVDLDLTPSIGLQLMAKDYIGKFDVREATMVDVDTRTSHNWSFNAGLRIGL